MMRIPRAMNKSGSIGMHGLKSRFARPYRGPCRVGDYRTACPPRRVVCHRGRFLDRAVVVEMGGDVGCPEDCRAWCDAWRYSRSSRKCSRAQHRVDWQTGAVEIALRHSLEAVVARHRVPLPTRRQIGQSLPGIHMNAHQQNPTT